MKTCAAKRRRNGGFTLMEVMMVVMIIGILAGLVLAISGAAARKSDRTKALADMEKLKDALEQYRIANNTYYETSCDTQSDTVFQNKMKTAGGVTNLVFSDPWGRGFQYVRASKFSYTLSSNGPDGMNGTADDVSMSQGSM